MLVTIEVSTQLGSIDLNESQFFLHCFLFHQLMIFQLLFIGINVVRGQILNFASTRTIFNSGFKLVILDEADAMTNDAQNALRRIIEKFTDNVRFCLICNYLSKIIPALQSR